MTDHDRRFMFAIEKLWSLGFMARLNRQGGNIEARMGNGMWVIFSLDAVESMETEQ
jgi:hypothetical protein